MHACVHTYMHTQIQGTITATPRSLFEEQGAYYILLYHSQSLPSTWHSMEGLHWTGLWPCQWGIFFLVGMNGPTNLPPWAGRPEVCVQGRHHRKLVSSAPVWSLPLFLPQDPALLFPVRDWNSQAIETLSSSNWILMFCTATDSKLYHWAMALSVLRNLFSSQVICSHM